MCGRFVLDTTEKKIFEQLHVTLNNPIPNSFNIAPTESCLIVTQHDNQRIAQNCLLLFLIFIDIPS